MKCLVLSRAQRRGAAVVASAFLASGLMALPASQMAQAGVSGQKVDAHYKITLNGFDVGTLHYASAVEGSTYTLSSDVRLSFLLGAFQWKGVSRTVGTSTSKALSPTGFNFDFASTLKDGAIRMGFDKGNVRSVSIDPPSPPAEGTVPVQSQHLKGVLDPLSAIMSLTQGASGNPCTRKVAIFDGKQRFNLELAYRRQEDLGGGQAGTGTVCMVRYIPIAGYKASPETQALAANTGIEIVFRPVPSADLMVPHRVVLPTLAGTAEIAAERIDVRMPGQGQVALVD